MAVVTTIAAAWSLSPAVAVKVEGSAVLLQPDSRVGFYSRSAGQVQALPHRVGDAVRQGELLASLNRVDQAAADSPAGAGGSSSPRCC